MSGRDAILGRVREALAGREKTGHPGSFEGWRPETPSADSLEHFTDMFEAAGGEHIYFESETAAAAWVRDFARHFDGVALGAMARFPTATGATEGPHWMEPTEPQEAELGISMAHGAVAETGSLILSALGGRRTQLLPPTHLVWVDAGTIYPTLKDALIAMRGPIDVPEPEDEVVDLDAGIHDGLPSALGLHSGPSKSADIGQILVRGVHGPGRLVAVIVGGEL